MGRRLLKPESVLLSKPKVALAACWLLADAAGDDDAAYRWVQVALEGQFLGYRDGAQPFQFTRATFDQVIANIQAHPSYVAGAAGAPGTADVIPWDFGHASEMNPTEMAVDGSPAAGWTADFKIVNGPDGKAQLHALTRFLDPARGFVKAGAYKWASVALVFNATDGETAEQVGALITSIALTNTPFIEGMNELVAASRNAAAGTVELRRHWFEAAETPEMAFENMKELFGLSTMATADEVTAQVIQLRAMLDQDPPPIGVDVAEIIGSLRMILGEPVLTPASEVLDSTNEIIQRLIEDAAGTATPPATPAPDAEAAVAAGRDTTMDKFIALLANLLQTVPTEDAVKAAISEVVTLRAGVIVALGLDSNVATGVVLEAAKKQADARGKLAALITALGIENADEATDKIAALIQQGEDLKAAMPELEGLKVAQAEIETEQAETDVTEAMASYGLPDAVRPAMLLQRTAGEDKKVARAAFLTSFPKKDPEPAPAAAPGTPPAAQHAHLLQPAGVTASGMSVNPDGTIKLNAPAGTSVTAPGTAPLAQQVVLAQYPGANDTQRTMAYLDATREGYSKMDWDSRFKLAVSIKNSGTVVLTA